MIVYDSVKLLMTNIIFEILWLILIYLSYDNVIINCFMYIKYRLVNLNFEIVCMHIL